MKIISIIEYLNKSDVSKNRVLYMDRWRAAMRVYMGETYSLSYSSRWKAAMRLYRRDSQGL